MGFLLTEKVQDSAHFHCNIYILKSVTYY